MSSHRCGGECCRAFTIGSTPEQFGDIYLDAVARILAGEDRQCDWDNAFIGEMLIRIDEPDEVGPVYTCSHFVAETKLCGAYDQRPRMCSEYPSYGLGSPCVFCGFRELEPPDLVQLSGRVKVS